MIFSKIKLYALGALGVIMAALVAAVKILTVRNSQLARRAEHAEAKIERAKFIAKNDIRIEEEIKEVRREQKDAGNPGFNKPDSLWGDTDD